MTACEPPEARPYCYRCDKAQSMCICHHLTPIDNAVGVHVLQHPRERRHALGTARLLRLGLASAHIHVLELEGGRTPTTPVDLPEGAGLLYPSPDARDIATLPPRDRPEHLVVIDGTWPQAQRLYRNTPWISALPCYRLDPEHGSNYRLRAEPRQECLSTVESVVAALRALQPDLRGTETLLMAFDAMIDAQIEAARHSPSAARVKRPRRAPAQPIPARLLTPGVRIVVVYAEAATREMTAPGPPAPARLSAVSLDGARVFDRLARTRLAPDAYMVERMGLPPDAMTAAEPGHDVLAAFQEFCAATAPNAAAASPAAETPHGQAAPVLVSWNQWTHRWLEENGGDLPCVLLKGVWANLTGERVPHLETLVQTLQLPTPHLPLTGRARARLAHALAMARHILDDASREA